MRVPLTMWVGTMVRTPLDSKAGLNEPEAVWPFTTGSVSTISNVARWGISIEMALRIVEIWLETPFEGGRHARRVVMIEKT